MLICYQSNKEKTMFEISPETKESAIEEMKKVLPGHTEDEYAAAFDACVDIVKKQFSL